MGRSSAARTVWLQALKEARVARGLSQAELGAMVGLPQSHISRIESGAVDVGISALLEICRSLGLGTHRGAGVAGSGRTLTAAASLARRPGTSGLCLGRRRWLIRFST
ncbi:MAG: helix-turn-helix transcriptional regulator [Gammaproteobacteria bacterium]|nr:helix-turn-helix transcriptional regulator [Gammaproteobacteria bacterium]